MAGNQSIVGVGMAVCVTVDVGDTGVGDGTRLLQPENNTKESRKSGPKKYLMSRVFRKNLIILRT